MKKNHPNHPKPRHSRDTRMAFAIEWLRAYYDERCRFLTLLVPILRLTVIVSFVSLWYALTYHEPKLLVYIAVLIGLTASYLTQRAHRRIQEATGALDQLEGLGQYSHNYPILLPLIEGAKYKALVAVCQDNTFWYVSEPCIEYNGTTRLRYYTRHFLRHPNHEHQKS